jgi:hypothetical protein
VRHGLHVPVCDGQQLHGMVSMRDIILQDLSEKDDEVHDARLHSLDTVAVVIANAVARRCDWGSEGRSALERYSL